MRNPCKLELKVFGDLPLYYHDVPKEHRRAYIGALRKKRKLTEAEERLLHYLAQQHICGEIVEFEYILFGFTPEERLAYSLYAPELRYCRVGTWTQWSMIRTT